MNDVNAKGLTSFDAVRELIIFSDFIAPKLDVYEQAIYIFLLRQSHLDGKESITIGLKSARKKIGFGTGDNSKPMSESTLTLKVQKLINNGLLERLGSDRNGTRLSVVKPSKTSFQKVAKITTPELDIQELDCFEDPIARKAILEREGHKCFYCHIRLDADNYVMEHVVSRPSGDNTYRNIVAACRSCNNKKSEKTAETHLRKIFRDGLLSEEEFHERLEALADVLAGRLVPKLHTD